MYFCDMNNTRFSTAIHILTLLAMFPEEWMSSEYIAGSIGINAVVVRREISMLKKNNLIKSKQGKEGGCQLSKLPREIVLSDIFLHIQSAEILGKKNRSANPKCVVGRSINQHLNTLSEQTNQVVIQFLGKQTLQDFVDNFKQ